MPNTTYAQGVVRAALKKTPNKWLWEGAKVTMIRFARDWVGAWVFDLVLPRMFGLVRLSMMMKQKANRG